RGVVADVVPVADTAGAAAVGPAAQRGLEVPPHRGAQLRAGEPDAGEGRDDLRVVAQQGGEQGRGRVHVVDPPVLEHVDHLTEQVRGVVGDVLEPAVTD